MKFSKPCCTSWAKRQISGLADIYDTDKYYQESICRSIPRNFLLTFSYKFGKENFMQQKRQQENVEG